jgi:hypothetical protein
MKHLSKSATQILDKLTQGLVRAGDSRKVNTAPGTFMAVCVENIGSSQFSLAHYGEQNGDLMKDPEVVFTKRANGEWYPLTYENSYVGKYTEAVEYNPDGTFNVNQKAYNDLRSFCATWMRNIAEQQDLSTIKAGPDDDE